MGFVSVRADARTGVLTTKPFTFTGNQLEINYSTSIAGSIRIALLDEAGDSLSKFALDDCPHIFGDEIARTVRWENINAIDIQQPVRLQFELIEADSFLLDFQSRRNIMKIVKIEQFFPRRRMRLIKITTDTGIVGWGETTLEASPEAHGCRRRTRGLSYRERSLAR